jgi:hypothetical protein
MKNSTISAGKLIISFLSIFTIAGPYLADWNETHIFNPNWMPHAKFHNAQTMVLGTFLGLITLYWLWVRKSLDDKQGFKESTFIVSLYWVSQFPAILFPGTMLVDPIGKHVEMPIIFGVQFNQLVMNCTVVIPLIILSTVLEIRRLNQN